MEHFLVVVVSAVAVLVFNCLLIVCMLVCLLCLLRKPANIFDILLYSPFFGGRGGVSRGL